VSGPGLISVISALAVVLGALMLTLWALRRYAPGMRGPGATINMSILRRMPLGPRQGIAVVQVQGRVFAVSVGDGGVRMLTELDNVPLTPAPGSVPVEGTPNFGAALKSAAKAFRVGALLLAVGAAGFSAPRAVHAQASVAAPATARTGNAATASQSNAAARLDSMIPRLAPQMQLQVGGQGTDGLRLSGTVGIVVMMGLLTMLPMLVLMMTGFTRILIVMHFLRQAIGTQSAPPAQLVAGLSLLLTLFVMAPTLEELNRTALTPWMDGTMEQGEMMKVGVVPFRTFMLAQTRDADLENFLELSGRGPVETEEEIPLVVLTSAFVTSELRVAFQIGFALFLPFIVIDIVVASVLMSVGMMMVPPAMISLPFKLLLFVLVDGWTLITQSLIRSFA
jgi:flagellar biosynthetic protein FliP